MGYHWVNGYWTLLRHISALIHCRYSKLLFFWIHLKRRTIWHHSWEDRNNFIFHPYNLNSYLWPFNLHNFRTICRIEKTNKVLNFWSQDKSFELSDTEIWAHLIFDPCSPMGPFSGPRISKCSMMPEWHHRIMYVDIVTSQKIKENCNYTQHQGPKRFLVFRNSTILRASLSH